tara:strand:- start:442 stop:1191 length:750 start_codon:yes stop_codon:yes gene_type:complete
VIKMQHGKPIRPPKCPWSFRGAPGSESDEHWFYNHIKDSINTIYDVGASDNSIYLEFLGEVHYFEPTDRLEALKLKENKNEKSYFLNYGLSNTTSEDTKVTWETGGVLPRKDGTLEYFNLNGDLPIKNIKTVTGLEYMNRMNQKTVDFLKIDTEGHELEIIKGFGERIADVNIIQFEYSGINWAMNISMLDIIDYLMQFGFCEFSYAAVNGLERIDVESFEDHYHWCNVVCFQRDFLDKLTNHKTLFYK